MIPNVLTLGPLLASKLPGTTAGNLCANDPTCIAWLDKQAAGSVIYIAFGSTTFFKQEQFKELALGIEIVGRPFLWVVPSGAEYPDGFTESVWVWKNCGMGRPRKSVSPSFCCMFLFTLWMELNHGEPMHGGAFSVLASPWRSIRQ